MTSILKYDALESKDVVRLLDRPASAEPEPPREDPVIAALKADIAELREALHEAATAHAEALDAARTEGRRLAESEFRRDEAKALAALKAGVGEAAATVREHLGAAEALALVFSATALEKIVGDTSQYDTLIAQCIRLQVDGLRRDTILSVRVSAADFPDHGAADTLADELSIAREAITRDSTLVAGDCRIELRLGAIELSLSRHWDAVRALCRALAGQGATA